MDTKKPTTTETTPTVRQSTSAEVAASLRVAAELNETQARRWRDLADQIERNGLPV